MRRVEGGNGLGDTASGQFELAASDKGIAISRIALESLTHVADQPFSFELVPIELMKDNPDGLDLATPSIAFTVDDLGATHDALVGRGVQATDVGDHQGTPSFAFSDPEGRWFAVTQ